MRGLTFAQVWDAIVKVGPAVAALVRWIWKGDDDARVDAAVEKAVKTGDTSDLNDLTNGVRKH